MQGIRTVTTLSEHACFGGVQRLYQHDSDETGTPMKFGMPAETVSMETSRVADERREKRALIGLASQCAAHPDAFECYGKHPQQDFQSVIPRRIFNERSFNSSFRR